MRAELRRHRPNTVLFAVTAGLLAANVSQLAVAIAGHTQATMDECEAAMASPVMFALQLSPLPVIALVLARGIITT